VPPPQKFFFNFFWFNVFKKFLCSGQGGGHRPVPPLNTPLGVGYIAETENVEGVRLAQESRAEGASRERQGRYCCRVENRI